MDLKLWGTIVGWIVLIFGGGVAWGHHNRQIAEHQKTIDKFDTNSLMTEKKCEALHDTWQETTDVKLNNIEAMLNEMKTDRRKIDERLGALSSKIDVMYDRWERSNG